MVKAAPCCIVLARCSTLVTGLTLKCPLLRGKAALAVSRRAFADEQPLCCVVSSLLAFFAAAKVGCRCLVRV